MNDRTNPIRERFPDQSDAIGLLVAKEPEFRAICEDYHDCLKALQYWSRSRAPDAEARVNEYRTLIQGLEEEIKEAMDAVNLPRLV